MKLEPTQVQHTYKVGNPASGYIFTVTATLDPDLGWGAKVEMKSHGFVSPESSIKHLGLAASKFIEATSKLETK